MRCALAVVFVFVPGFALALSDLDDGWAMMQRHICGKSKPEPEVQCYRAPDCRLKMRKSDTESGFAEGIDAFLLAYATDRVKACKAKSMAQ